MQNEPVLYANSLAVPVMWNIFTMQDRPQCITLTNEFHIFNKTIRLNTDLFHLWWSYVATAIHSSIRLLLLPRWVLHDK